MCWFEDFILILCTFLPLRDEDLTPLSDSRADTRMPCHQEMPWKLLRVLSKVMFEKAMYLCLIFWVITLWSPQAPRVLNT